MEGRVQDLPPRAGLEADGPRPVVAAHDPRGVGGCGTFQHEHVVRVHEVGGARAYAVPGARLHRRKVARRSTSASARTAGSRSRTPLAARSRPDARRHPSRRARSSRREAVEHAHPSRRGAPPPRLRRRPAIRSIAKQASSAPRSIASLRGPSDSASSGPPRTWLPSASPTKARRPPPTSSAGGSSPTSSWRGGSPGAARRQTPPAVRDHRRDPHANARPRYTLCPSSPAASTRFSSPAPLPRPRRGAFRAMDYVLRSNSTMPCG